MTNDFPQLAEGFFLRWMDAGRRLSPQTIASYRDAFCLLVRWFGDERGIAAGDVSMDDLTAENVEAFLLFLSDGRGNSATTADCRLAAIKAFCSYAAHGAPERIAGLRRISDIPRRTEKRREVDYLTREEVGWLLSECDRATARGREDHLIISLPSGTGARVSELVGIRAGDLEPRGGRRVLRILGKGRKERTLPLWPDVARELSEFVADRRLEAGDFVFAGRNVEHMSRSGARSRIDSVARRATKSHPQLAGKRISPHVFRHSCAMSMLESGVDLSTIAIWLGHESVQTTHKYMVASMARKEAALSKVHPVADPGGHRRYAPKGDVLDFLMSL